MRGVRGVGGGGWVGESRVRGVGGGGRWTGGCSAARGAGSGKVSWAGPRPGSDAGLAKSVRNFFYIKIFFFFKQNVSN